MKFIPKRTFLLRQDERSGGKTKDVIAKKGEAIELTEKEAKRFAADILPVGEAPAKKK